MDTNKKMTVYKCSECGAENVNDDEINFADDGTPVCEKCWESAFCEPLGTVHYSDASGELEADGETSVDQITYYHNPSPFKVEYKHTDGWRGYYYVKESPGWVRIHDDAILSYSEDAKNLECFDKRLMAFCSTHNITLARVTLRTSNVFCTGCDYFVPESSANLVRVAVAMLAIEHRDRDKFESTALTGSDPADQDAHDKLYIKAVKAMEGGKSLEDAIKEVLEK
jgi:DNA-directed RNA polymerase subunit RPC12/RpoP